MKNFKLYLRDMQTGKIGADNPNINAPNVHRKVLQYKVKDLRRGIWQAWRTRFRKNKLYNPKRYLNRISNKIKEEKRRRVNFLIISHFRVRMIQQIALHNKSKK